LFGEEPVTYGMICKQKKYGLWLNGEALFSRATFYRHRNRENAVFWANAAEFNEYWKLPTMGQPMLFTTEQEKEIIWLIYVNVLFGSIDVDFCQVQALALKVYNCYYKDQRKAPSKHWVAQFLKRYPNLCKEFPTIMEGRRIKAGTVQARADFYNKLNKQVEATLLEKDENGTFKYDKILIVDMDETSIGDKNSVTKANRKRKKRRVGIVGFAKPQAAAEASGYHLTKMSIIVNNGLKLSPAFILSKKTCTTEEVKALDKNFPDSLVLHTKNGSTTADLMVPITQHVHDQLKSSMEAAHPGIADPLARTKVILTYDMPSCHDSLEAILLAKELGMSVWLKPPNSTSWSQACDNEAFHGTLKQAYDKGMRERITNGRKPTFLDQLIVLRSSLDSITRINVQKAFTHVGFPTLRETYTLSQEHRLTLDSVDVRSVLGACQQKIIDKGTDQDSFTNDAAERAMLGHITNLQNKGKKRKRGLKRKHAFAQRQLNLSQLALTEAKTCLKRNFENARRDAVAAENERVNRSRHKLPDGGIDATSEMSVAALVHKSKLQEAKKADAQDKKESKQLEDVKKFRAADRRLVALEGTDNRVGLINLKNQELQAAEKTLAECAFKKAEADKEHASSVLARDALKERAKIRRTPPTADEKKRNKVQLEIQILAARAAKPLKTVANNAWKDALKQKKQLAKALGKLETERDNCRGVWDKLAEKLTAPQIRQAREAEEEDEDGDVIMGEVPADFTAWDYVAAANPATGSAVDVFREIVHDCESVTGVMRSLHRSFFFGIKWKYFKQEMEAVVEAEVVKLSGYLRKACDEHTKTEEQKIKDSFVWKFFKEQAVVLSIMLLVSGKVSAGFDDARACILTDPVDDDVWTQVDAKQAGYFGAYVSRFHDQWVRSGKASGEGSDIYTRQNSHNLAASTTYGQARGGYYALQPWNEVCVYLGFGWHKSDQTVGDAFHWSEETGKALEHRKGYQRGNETRRPRHVNAQFCMISYALELAFELCQDEEVNCSKGLGFETFLNTYR
jgi:hypothetical protein